MAKTGRRVIGKLSTIAVEQRKKRGLLGDGGGLFLQVSATGAKSWVFRFKEDGRLRVMGLGPVHTISLAEARDKALLCRKARLDGRNPIEERRAKRRAERIERAKAVTFRECAGRYIEAHKAGWRNAKHAAQWTATLETYVYPVVGGLPVQAVDLGLVMRVLDPIWREKPETASRVRGRIEAILGWATTRGYRQGDNPARWRGHLENLLPARSKVARVEHHAPLPYDVISAFVTELREQEGIAARALEFAMLTAARTGNRRCETVMDGARRTHEGGSRAPGAARDRAMAIVNEMRKVRIGDFVFAANRGRGWRR